MKSTFTPLIISILPGVGFCALLWSDGQRCETADFSDIAEAHHSFNAMCKHYPGAVRVINGEIQPRSATNFSVAK